MSGANEETRTANPFANSGGIVYGSRFIGRDDALEAIEDRVILPSDAGSIAIVGDTRVGKSSLAYQALMLRRDDLERQRIIVVWVNLGKYQHSAAFFRDLVALTEEELASRKFRSEIVRLKAEQALIAEAEWGQGYRRLCEFFETVRREGLRVIIIVDEFDHARQIFKGDVTGFQALRDLCYYPQWKVSFVLTSRRSIHDIEVQTAAISTFNLVVGKYYLGLFGNEEIDVFWNRLNVMVPGIESKHLQQMTAVCGSHPYLLDIVAFELVRSARNPRDGIDVAAAAREALPNVLDYYATVIGLLRQEGSLANLLQILFGPVLNVGEDDLLRFLRYGLIREVAATPQGGSYTAFSEHFHDYLRLEERSIDIWPLWRKTETSLRDFIADRLTMEYGEDWVEALAERPKLRSIIEMWRTAAQREHRNFGYRSSPRLIDFSYPRDLFTVMFAEWKLFAPALGHDPAFWNERGELLARVRNPLAHGRDRVLPQREREDAEKYCAEILGLISTTA